MGSQQQTLEILLPRYLRTVLAFTASRNSGYNWANFLAEATASGEDLTVVSAAFCCCSSDFGRLNPGGVDEEDGDLSVLVLPLPRV